jgi:hypothetical protein
MPLIKVEAVFGSLETFYHIVIGPQFLLEASKGERRDAFQAGDQYSNSSERTHIWRRSLGTNIGFTLAGLAPPTPDDE